METDIRRRKMRKPALPVELKHKAKPSWYTNQWVPSTNFSHISPAVWPGIAINEYIVHVLRVV